MGQFDVLSGKTTVYLDIGHSAHTDINGHHDDCCHCVLHNTGCIYDEWTEVKLMNTFKAEPGYNSCYLWSWLYS